MEEALRRSEEKFAKAFNFSPNPMVICMFEDGRLVEVNESFMDVTGFRLEEIIGQTPVEIDSIGDSRLFAKAMQMLARPGIVSQPGRTC